MVEILLNLLLISFSCLGYHLAGYEGFLLDWMSKYFREKEGFLFYLGHTIINCPRCMSSFHMLIFSPLILQYFFPFPIWVLAADYFLTGIGAVAFMNSVLINWFEKIK